MPETLWTIDDFCRFAQVSRIRAWQMVREGILPEGVTVRFGRAIRIDPAALRAFMANGGFDRKRVHERAA